MIGRIFTFIDHVLFDLIPWGNVFLVIFLLWMAVYIWQGGK